MTPAPSLVDSHCHIAGSEFTGDLEAVVTRAREAGVRQALVILASEDEAELGRAHHVADLWPEVRFSVGVHPHNAGPFAAGAALPLTRDAFRDARYHSNTGHALLTAFVLIPLGTVLFEEVAFRGVLWALLRRWRGTRTATAVSSALFGLWHVLPSLGLAGDKALDV